MTRLFVSAAAKSSAVSMSTEREAGITCTAARTLHMPCAAACASAARRQT